MIAIFFSIPCSWELWMQKLKSHLVRTLSLNVLPLKPGVDQYIAIHATLTARDFFFLIPTLLVHSPAFFSKTSSESFLCWLWLRPVPVWARRIKSITLLIVTDNGCCTKRLFVLCFSCCWVFFFFFFFWFYFDARRLRNQLYWLRAAGLSARQVKPGVTETTRNISFPKHRIILRLK